MLSCIFHFRAIIRQPFKLGLRYGHDYWGLGWDWLSVILTYSLRSNKAILGFPFLDDNSWTVSDFGQWFPYCTFRTKATRILFFVTMIRPTLLGVAHQVQLTYIMWWTVVFRLIHELKRIESWSLAQWMMHLIKNAWDGSWCSWTYIWHRSWPTFRKLPIVRWSAFN